MHDKCKREDHTRERNHSWGQRMSKEDEECEWEVFGRGKDVFLSREIG